MRKFITVFTSLFLVLLLVPIALSQISFAWQYNGIPLRQGYHIEWQRAGAIDDEGNVCYVWSDTRYGDRDVFAQKYNQQGVALWPEGGAIVAQAPIRQEDPDCCPDNQGGFIVSWVDFRADSMGDIYVQKIDANGIPQWAPLGDPYLGVLVSSIPFAEQKMLHTIPDGQGGAILVWHDLRNDEGDLYGHHIQSNGVLDPAWGENGKIIARDYGDQGGANGQSVDTDGNGGVIVAWGDTRDPANTDIYIQRVTINGVLAWSDSSGVPVCSEGSEQNGVKLAPDGSGGAFLVWVDKRNYATTREDLYMQKFNHSGQTLFATNGIPMNNESNKQELPRIVYDGTGGVISVWEDFRNDPLNLVSDVFAQRINASGQKLWNTAGLAVCTAGESQYGVRLDSDNNGNAVIAWIDDRSGTIPRSNIYGQRLLANGTYSWQTNGMIISDAPYMQMDPLVRSHTDGKVYVSWADYRQGSPGVYCQFLNPDGSVNLTPNGQMVVYGIDGHSTHPRAVQISQNPQKILVVWEDLRYTYSGYFIYQQIFDYSGNFTFPFNGKPVALDYSDLDQLEGGQQKPEVILDGEGGAIVCWEDYRISNLSIPQIYVQKIDVEGNPVWPDSTGIRLHTTDLDEKEPKICSDGLGGAFIAWTGYNSYYRNKTFVAHIESNANIPIAYVITGEADSITDENANGIFSDGAGGAIVYWRSGVFDFDVYAARLNADCETLWVKPVCALQGDMNNQLNPIGLMGDGFMYFVWSDLRSYMDYDLYGQKFDMNGNPLWGINGIPICDEVNDQVPTDLAQNGEGNIYVIWQDFRSGINNDVYLQKLSGVDGDLLFLETGLPVAVETNGDQWNAKMWVADWDGVFTLWEDLRNPLGADIYASHFNPNGTMLGGWNNNGDVVCDFYNRQIFPQVVGNFHNGLFAFWEEARSSGKAELLNLYMQNFSDVNAVSENESNTPSTMQLCQNYPNPFNPNTMIGFTLKEAGKVRLAVFNSLGREVRVLRNQYFNSGHYDVQWDGYDDAGKILPSGIYFYRLELDNQMRTMRMLYLK